MIEYTKGPWKLEKRKKQTWVSGFGWQGLAKVFTCLEGSHPNDKCNDLGKANAKLIVVAPELLESLKECLETLTHDTTQDQHDLAIQNAYRTIQKATGLEEAEACLPKETTK